MTSPKSTIPLHDPATGGSILVVADRQVQWTSGAAWAGITAEVYSFEGIATPEFQIVDHLVALHLSGPAVVELKIDGQQDTRLRGGGDISFLSAGTVCQVKSGAPHEVLVVSVSQQIINNCGVELRESPPSAFTARGHLIDPQIEHICMALKAEGESSYACGRLYGESLALALASRLMGQYSTRDVPSTLAGGLAPQVLRRVIDYIESDLATPLRMNSLAEIAGLSQFRFAHNFKAHTGLPPYRYVMRARIERAKRILRETNLSIVEVALAVGFQSSGQFNSIFKREIGITPGAFRGNFR